MQCLFAHWFCDSSLPSLSSPEATQCPTEADRRCHGQLQHSHLGNPETPPHAHWRAHPTQTNQIPLRWWCLPGVTTHPKLPGVQSPGEHSPLLLQPVLLTMAICPHFQGEGSLLQRIALGRLLTAQKSQTNGQVFFFPPFLSKISRGESRVAWTFFSGWGSDASFLSCVWCSGTDIWFH